MNKAELFIKKLDHQQHVHRRHVDDVDSVVQNILFETLTNRKFAPGKVNFTKSAFKDPHIELIINEMAKQSGVTKQQIIASVDEELEKVKPMLKLAPLLYSTIKDNIVESSVFKVFQQTDVKKVIESFSFQ